MIGSLVFLTVAIGSILVMYKLTNEEYTRAFLLCLLVIFILIGALLMVVVLDNQLDTLECETAIVNDTPVYVCKVKD